MTVKLVRFVVRGGRLVPLEPVSLVEGAEFDVTLPVVSETSTDAAAESPAAKPRVRFRTWNLGVKKPITREDAYDDD